MLRGRPNPRRRSPRVALALACAVALGVAGASPAVAQGEWSVPADALGSDGDQHVDYPPWSSQTHAAPAMAVGAVGDVNGDGLEDLAAGFGSSWAENSVYVTFSDRLGGAGDALGFGGFRIVAPWFWYGVSSAGDVNGDGLGDVAVLHTNSVSVVFGKLDGGTVHTSDLGSSGFTITGAGAGVSGGSEVYYNAGVVPLNDLNGDGVRDLLVQAGGDAAIVYPPRDAAGRTIDASVPGPYASRLTASDERRLDDAYVGTLGDLDGDGRDDVLVAGEEREGTDQVAYGVASPLPGTAVDLPSAVAAGRAFELRSHDGQPGWYGELESAFTLGDQDGDRRRDVGMTGHRNGHRHLRVAYSPAFGARVDIDDLGAADARGYRMRTYSDVIDVGDQNGDGRGDIATRNYVYFTDPARETGDREPVHSGFHFSFPGGGGTIVAPIADLNGDVKPELAVARVDVERNGDGSEWQGERATYAVDVFDSAGAPAVPLPDPPVELPGGGIEVPIEIGTGAGLRGGRTLGLRPRVELATATGPADVAADGGLTSSDGRTKRLALRASSAGGAPLRAGETYRVRYAVDNGRGLASVGPWRTFRFDAPPSSPSPGTSTRNTIRGTRRADRLIGTRLPDLIVGLGGDDALFGRAADDELRGGPGRDRLAGERGADVLRGGAGGDRLRGGPGRDLLDGGAGDDAIESRDGERDVVRCGRGRDSVRADRRDRLSGCERRRR
jgi:hypothetical protein